MNQLKFIDRNLYGLEREYGVSASLGVSSAMTNRSTGVKTQHKNEIYIPKAIQLPTNVTFEFLRAIGIIPQQQGLDALTSSIQFVIRRKYVPINFPIEPSRTYMIVNGRRHELVKAQTFEYSILLWVKAVERIIRQVTNFESRLTFKQTLVNT